MALDSERLRPECVDCLGREPDPSRIWGPCVGATVKSRPSHWTPCPLDRIPPKPHPIYGGEDLHHYPQWDGAWGQIEAEGQQE
jgi:hypothetical protein